MQLRGVVLVEGASDRHAVETLARRRGRDLRAEGVAVVPMGGYGNLPRLLRQYRDLRLAGLYDLGEERHFLRALGCDDRGGLERVGFYACARDLEDELTRAVGPDGMERVLAEQGELRAFRTYQKQPAHRARPLAEQLHGFMWNRKQRYAVLLIEALDLERVPRPLDRVLAHVSPPRARAGSTARDTTPLMLEAVRDQLLEAPVEQKQRVTALELFFDLVFVFAITQVTGFLYRDPTWTRLVEAFAILMVLWFAWTAYAWLGNTAGSDEGAMRVVLLAAMAPLLVASLAVPHAFGKDALVFGVAYFLVRTLHILAYALLARGNPQLRAAVFRLARTILPAAAVLVLAGALSGTGRAVCWGVALAVDYGGLLLSSTEGWRVEPAHFAERHGLIIIIALGESIVALGVGAAELELGVGVVTGVVLGLAVAACLWWAYFDVVAAVAERKLREAGPVRRPRIARDSYSYLHLPMVGGIVIFAFGVKETLVHVHAHLESVPAAALCGGVALYLLALSAFKRRNVGSFNYPRLVASAALVALAPVAVTLPALLSLGLVAGTACGLIGYEVLRYAETRDRIRHGDRLT